jgi:hypothetical protein
MLRLARATQKLLYPEFLPDPNRPQGLPGTREDEGRADISSNYGTLRYGRLLEVLLYDNRRSGTCTAPPLFSSIWRSKAWLKTRMKDKRDQPCSQCAWSASRMDEGKLVRVVPRCIRSRESSIAGRKPIGSRGGSPSMTVL